MQQETQNLSCSNCLHPYDLSAYLPLNLPTCSHSLCNDCINILKEFGEIFKCPIDEINCNFKNFQLQDFTVNTALKEQLEASQDPNICKLHKQELRIRCLRDGSRICHQCIREDLHSGHDTKRIEEIVSESQAKVELLENCIQELTGYSEKIEKKLEDVEKSLIDIINSHCDRFGTKEERKKAIIAHVKSTTENEKRALEELLGAGSATKMKAVTKIVFLKSLTLENMKEDLKEEDLDISKYLKLITKEKFEKQYNEIEKQFEKRKNKYYVAIDLYKQDDYRIENMEAHSIVREKLNYLTGQPLQKRIKEVVVANKGWLKLVLFGFAFFLLAYIMIITGAAKPFGKDLSKYKIFKEIGKSWKHMKKAAKKKEEKFPFMNKKGRGRRPRFRFL